VLGKVRGYVHRRRRFPSDSIIDLAAVMPGYSLLGRMIGKRRELGMFRSFSGLEAQSLLYMQAELLQIESDMEAFVSLPEMDPFNKSFSYATEKGTSDDTAIWRAKFDELRGKLSVYCEMMRFVPSATWVLTA
jgi:hypothetical protein